MPVPFRDHHESSAGDGPGGMEGAQLWEASLWPTVFRDPAGGRARLLHASRFAGHWKP